MAGKVSARSRAREATAALLAKRRGSERRIEEGATAYYAAAEQVDVATQALDEAQAKRLDALSALVALGLTNEQVVELCACDLADVRAARKQARAATAPTDEAGDDPAPESVG